MQTKKEKRKNAEVAITGTLPKETIEPGTEKTLLSIQKELHLPGFRKGTAPLGRVREYVGEKALWKETAEYILRQEIKSILKEHGVTPIMPVDTTLGMSEAGADMPFEIVAVIAPTCSTGNYKDTAQKALEKITLLDAEKEKEMAITALRAQSRLMIKSEGEGVLADEEAKKLGFENPTAAEFFLKDEAERAVKEREVQRKRSAIAEALIEKAACDLPRVLVRQETLSLLEATKRDVAGQGLPFNEFLKQRNKTEAEIQAELEAPAEKRVALDIIFSEIARAEDIKPDQENEERLAHVLLQQGVEHETAHRYVRSTIMRERVWELLGAKSENRT